MLNLGMYYCNSILEYRVYCSLGGGELYLSAPPHFYWSPESIVESGVLENMRICEQAEAEKRAILPY